MVGLSVCTYIDSVARVVKEDRSDSGAVTGEVAGNIVRQRVQ